MLSIGTRWDAAGTLLERAGRHSTNLQFLVPRPENRILPECAFHHVPPCRISLARRCCPERPQTSLPLRRRRTMGQSLSNLCGIKPAEPKQWPAFEAKMKAEGLSDAAIASFKHNFVTLASGANLMISEAPPRVRPGSGRQPALAPTPLCGSARLWPPQQCAVRAPRASGACANAGSLRPGPPRPGAARFASGSRRAYHSLTHSLTHGSGTSRR